MEAFEINAVSARHIAELQAESRHMILARSVKNAFGPESPTDGFARRVGAAFGRVAQAIRVPGGPSPNLPA